MSIKPVILNILHANPSLDYEDLVIRGDGEIGFTCKHGKYNTLYSEDGSIEAGCIPCLSDKIIVQPDASSNKTICHKCRSWVNLDVAVRAGDSERGFFLCPECASKYPKLVL